MRKSLFAIGALLVVVFVLSFASMKEIPKTENQSVPFESSSSKKISEIPPRPHPVLCESQEPLVVGVSKYALETECWSVARWDTDLLGEPGRYVMDDLYKTNIVHFDASGKKTIVAERLDISIAEALGEGLWYRMDVSPDFTYVKAPIMSFDDYPLDTYIRDGDRYRYSEFAFSEKADMLFVERSPVRGTDGGNGIEIFFFNLKTKVAGRLKNCPDVLYSRRLSPDKTKLVIFPSVKEIALCDLLADKIIGRATVGAGEILAPGIEPYIGEPSGYEASWLDGDTVEYSVFKSENAFYPDTNTLIERRRISVPAL